MKQNRLTRQQVVDMRALRRQGEKLVVLALRFGVAVDTVTYHTNKDYGVRKRQKSLERYYANRERILARWREKRRAA